MCKLAHKDLVLAAPVPSDICNCLGELGKDAMLLQRRLGSVVFTLAGLGQPGVRVNALSLKQCWHPSASLNNPVDGPTVPGANSSGESNSSSRSKWLCPADLPEQMPSEIGKTFFRLHILPAKNQHLQGLQDTCLGATCFDLQHADQKTLLLSY